MNYNFEERIERRGTGCFKWDYMPRLCGRPDLLSMGIADMDLACPPQIPDAIYQKTKDRIFGYGMPSPHYYESIVRWMKTRHHFEILPKWIVPSGRVVSAIAYALRTVTKKNDEIMLLTPVYDPFYRIVEELGRRVVRSSLRPDAQGVWRFSIEDMQRHVSDHTRALLLCNPHNPIGRVWSREELIQLGAFCQRHELFVICDEIHHDIVFQPHTVFASLSPALAARTITCTAPGKTFNLSGLHCANTIIPDQRLRERFCALQDIVHDGEPNCFVEAAVTAAYDRCGEWLDALLSHLEGNLDYFRAALSQTAPELRMEKPEGTYLAWVDCSALTSKPEDLMQFFVDRCGLGVNLGAEYGSEGDGYVRINLACPRSLAEEAVRRIQKGITWSRTGRGE